MKINYRLVKYTRQIHNSNSQFRISRGRFQSRPTENTGHRDRRKRAEEELPGIMELGVTRGFRNRKWLGGSTVTRRKSCFAVSWIWMGVPLAFTRPFSLLLTARDARFAICDPD